MIKELLLAKAKITFTKHLIWYIPSILHVLIY